MERDGLLVKKQIGRTRVYSFSPRYPFTEELSKIVTKAIDLSPASLREKLLLDRRRPRKKDKPL